MKMYDLFTQIISVTGFLVEGGKCLKIIDNIFASGLFKAPLDVFLSSIWNIGPDIGPRTSIDMLRVVSE